MPTERKNKSASTSPNINDSHSTLNIRQRTFAPTSASSTYPLGISFLSTSTTLNESEDMAYIEKRTAHNALERQRREGLNSKFQELAHVLPALQQIRRPSKSMIVSKSLEFVSTAVERRTDYEDQLESLRLENAQLVRQAEISTKRLKSQIEKDRTSTPKKPKKQVTAKATNSSKPISVIRPRKSSSKMKPQLRQSSLPINNKPSSSNCSPVQDNTEPTESISAEPPSQKRSRDDTSPTQKTMHQPHEIVDKRRRRNLTTEINSSDSNSTLVNYRSHVDQPAQPNRHNRYSSHQPFSAATNLNDIISPGSSRHNSITSDQLTVSYNDTIDPENETLVVPSQFDIVATSTHFSGEQTYYNTFENFENVVSTIPALRTPIGRNTTTINQQSYDPSLDIFNSLMQDQNSSNNNTNYYWHP
ncbi:hypothetical protein EDC94DRAFT_682204 [Helicostylum pulchrum]|nr:hypothetical protein EDC94DRAFT_682204 [Helicostylum pulchrum]